MINLILETPNLNAFKGDANQWTAFRGPVRRNDEDTDDVLGSVFYWRGEGKFPNRASRADIANKYIRHYRLTDGIPGATPDDPWIEEPTYTNKLYVYLLMTEEDFQTLLDQTNPVGIMPGGTKILYASGLSDPENPTWGTAPSNGVQHVFA